MQDHASDSLLQTYAERMRPHLEKFAWPVDTRKKADVPIDEAIAAMRRVADSMGTARSRDQAKAIARAVGAEADKWRPKMNGDKSSLDRIDVFIRNYL